MKDITVDITVRKAKLNSAECRQDFIDKPERYKLILSCYSYIWLLTNCKKYADILPH